ncbi:MAG: endo alpha-1,4 polygalactosaminidase [Clostridiales bacterium]|nr:endo alpha-1,4 polygalactosaminidase [Clostridiales bacterium]
MKKVIVLLAAVLASFLLLTACKINTDKSDNKSFKYQYGVFLSVEDDLDSLNSYKTVVIDAQNFRAVEINKFRDEGHKVFSYINIGSLENFRDYYDEYADLALEAYEHWEEEVWIDVSDVKWQQFVVNELIPSLIEKGIDGFFVDNCDVYYNYTTPEIMNGLTVMMNAMVDTGLEVIINGGDCYLDAYCAAGGSWDDVITGINQETVFSKINWEDDSFGRADAEDHLYFKDYIERYDALGADIYLLEYTTDEKLIKEINRYCVQKGFYYYISDSIELV